MKLIPLIIFITSLAVEVTAQKFRQEYFPFPPQFQPPNDGIFSTDSSLYLPPESHTSLPYFPMKNVNNLQYPLLPPTGTKAPSMYPTPFPFMISTTLVPNFEDDDDDEDHGRIRFSTSPRPLPQKTNQTEKGPEPPTKEKREMRPIPNMFQQSIQNRNDAKFQFKTPSPAPTVAIPSPANTSPASRRMIISAETQRSDLGLDQLRAASYHGTQFLPAGPGLYVSSTTEPAIPILRLSNEMDLDGSFSYEALGADQTHYVQHSRMENMGTDKQEQVVEGSYSYVGDNGQTYTVHYVADSNGFRASGDHLPVAPPIPEIIQRAVQYNLAEEAKKPPHLKSWQDDGRDNEISESDKNHHFALPPPRNLFTGRTPEAFSYSYSQGSNTGNNLITAASNQAPIKTVDFTTEQSKPKPNNSPISPQITFLASQGAHVPSVNTIQDTISRMFTTEKSTLPQLVNYEAGIKEADHEPNKGLWRWQYGINANNLQQQPTKDTISRSFGEGDDIMINFSDMTSDQYTKMIRSQFEESSDNGVVNQYAQNDPPSDVQTTLPKQNHNQEAKMLNEFQNQNNPNVQTQSDQKYYAGLNQNKETKMLDDYLDQNNFNVQSYVNQNNFAHHLEGKMLQDYQNQKNDQQNENQNNLASYFNKEKAKMSNDYVNNLNGQPKQNQNDFASYYHDQNAKMLNNEQNQKSPNKDHSMKIENNKPSTTTITFTTEGWFQHAHNDQLDYENQATSKPIESRKLISDNPKILTHKDFMYPTQTITQSYDFEEAFYEPRKIKALNANTMKPTSNSIINNVQDIYVKSPTPDNTWPKTENEIKESTTQEPYVSSAYNLKFTDFIVQESTSNFKPIITTTSTEALSTAETTTENIIEDILNNNIFLKNLFNAEKSERQNENKIVNTEEPKTVSHSKVEAEPKTDKISKVVEYQSKPNEIKTLKKNPVDIADILNYVSMKNIFESNKVKPKNKPLGANFDHKSEIRFIPIQQEREQNDINERIIPKQNNNYKTLNQEQQEEMRGLIKNYKVLHRNNNMKYDHSPLKRELSPPPLKSPLPPLGRAGPSMKSYLPPIYV